MRALLAGLLVAVMALGCAGCGGAPAASTETPTPTAIPAVLDVAGDVVVTDLDAIRYIGSGSRCTTRAPYADVREGTRLTVHSDTGAVTVVTELYRGRLVEGTGREKAGCAFSFSFRDAPGGRPTYYVRLAGRVQQLAVPVGRITKIRFELG